MEQSIAAHSAEELADFIWRTRYRDAAACPAESSLAQTWHRVSASVAAIESDPLPWSERFMGILRGFHFLPGALTLQQGGGVGYDFSTLRPRGARAVTTGAPASGPVSFLRVWDAMCATLLSTGARRSRGSRAAGWR